MGETGRKRGGDEAPRSRSRSRFAMRSLAAGASVAMIVPATGAALNGVGADSFVSELAPGPFTPAQIDPALAARVASDLADKGDVMRFTPAAGLSGDAGSRMMNVAVRVDDATARSITVRSPARALAERPGVVSSGAARIAIGSTRYDLGVARGYRKFANPTGVAKRLPDGVAKLAMPDLAEFRPAKPDERPSRFQPRIALEQDERAGRSPHTLQGLGEQAVELGGAYRVTRNLDVTAGVRLSQDRDRLDPLTDGVEDNQAVYVGTQLKF